MENCKPTSTPIECKNDFEQGKSDIKLLYRELIVTLIYLAVLTGLDIS